MEPYNKTEQFYVEGWLRRHSYRVDPISGNLDTTVTSPVGTVSVRNSLNGFKNPNWKSQLRLGQSATTPASGTRFKGRPQYYFGRAVFRRIAPPTSGNAFTAVDIDGFPAYDSLFVSDPSPSQDIIDQTTNRCIRKFLDQAMQARASIRGESAAEFLKTCKMLARPMTGIKNLTLDYVALLRKQKRKFGKSSRFDRVLADSYLEYTFGVRPLAEDVTSLLTHLLVKSEDRQYIAAGATTPFAHSTSAWDPTSQLAPGLFTTRGSRRVVSSYSIRYVGAVRTGAVNGSLPVPRNLGLSLSEVVPTVWAIIPYSFVADYFLNVGEVIDALCFRYDDIAWGNVTERRVAKYSYSTGPMIPNNSPSTHVVETLRQSGGSAEFQKVTFNRYAMTHSALLPTLRFNYPKVAKPWINCGVLLLAALQRFYAD